MEESELKCNRLVDELVQRFCAGREEFLALLQLRSLAAAQNKGALPSHHHQQRQQQQQPNSQVSKSCGVEKPANGVLEVGEQQARHGAISNGVLASSDVRGSKKARNLRKSKGRNVEGSRNGFAPLPEHSQVVAAEINIPELERRENGAILRPATPPAKKAQLSYVPEPPPLSFNLTDLESQELAPATPPSKLPPTDDDVTTPTIHSGTPLQPIRVNARDKGSKVSAGPNGTPTRPSRCNGDVTSGGVSFQGSNSQNTPKCSADALSENISAEHDGGNSDSGGGGGGDGSVDGGGGGGEDGGVDGGGGGGRDVNGGDGGEDGSVNGGGGDGRVNGSVDGGDGGRSDGGGGRDSDSRVGSGPLTNGVSINPGNSSLQEKGENEMMCIIVISTCKIGT